MAQNFISMLWKLPRKIQHVGNIGFIVNNMDVQALTLTSCHAKRHNMVAMPSRLAFHKISKVFISVLGATQYNIIALQIDITKDETLHDQSFINVSQPKCHHQSNTPHPIIETQQTLLSILKSTFTKKGFHCTDLKSKGYKTYYESSIYCLDHNALVS